MNQMYPIIRRARRSLWPEGEPVAQPPVEVAAPAEAELPPTPTPEDPVALVTVDAVPVEPTPAVETPSFALATEAATVEPKPKRGRRRGNAPE